MQPDEIAMKFATLREDLDDLWSTVRGLEKTVQVQILESATLSKSLTKVEDGIEGIRMALLGDGNGRRGYAERLRALETEQDMKSKNVFHIKLAIWAAVLSTLGNVVVFALEHMGG